MVKIYQVGGCVRDKFLNLKPKDIDYAVEASSYEEMKEHINKFGNIYVETPKYFTLRGKLNGIDADFTLCRKERGYSDNRRPDEVEVGTLYEDISRRDFTCNAIAIDEDDNVIDYFDGRKDIENGILRCVRDTKERLSEDGLRAFRALRFNVTKGLQFTPELDKALKSDWILPIIDTVSTERVRQEMSKCFEFSTLNTILLLEKYPKIREHLFSMIWLTPTVKKKSKGLLKMCKSTTDDSQSLKYKNQNINIKSA